MKTVKQPGRKSTLRAVAASPADQIVAIPTVIRTLPQPVKLMIGDLSNNQRALVGMELAVEP